jgi:hypothetical protein
MACDRFRPHEERVVAVLAILQGEASIEDYRRISAALNLEVTPPPGLMPTAAEAAPDVSIPSPHICEIAGIVRP